MPPIPPLSPKSNLEDLSSLNHPTALDSPPSEPLESCPLEDKPSLAEQSSARVWHQPLSRFLHTAGEAFNPFRPLKPLTDKLLDYFRVDDAAINDTIVQLRSQLPTTSALLIGKPQSGKSSIVRGLTGASAEIVGQGFQPHTQNTARYAYPSDDFPLLIFTDTVGLGDINHNADALIQELKAALSNPTDDGSPSAAKILIVTVKITDFATETLQQIVQTLRQTNPTIPCLLVVTCLHEVYPQSSDNHPAYPPDFETLTRAFAAIQTSFAPWIDGAVMIDFTREEDGYDPVFYGLTTLRDRLTAQLPAAEAQTLHQLLEGETGKRLGSLYRDVARRYILAFAVMAGTLAAVPLPFATMPVLTTLQISLVSVLGRLYGQVLTPSQAGGIASAIAGGFLAQAVGRELIKFVPGFGTVVAASWAVAYTWSLGEGACVYFGDVMGGKKPDPQKIQAVMRNTFNARRTAHPSDAETVSVDENISK